MDPLAKEMRRCAAAALARGAKLAVTRIERSANGHAVSRPSCWLTITPLRADQLTAENDG
jgi:hypothetical protein